MFSQDLYSPLSSTATKAQDDYATIYHRAVLKHLAKQVTNEKNALKLFDLTLAKMEEVLPRSSMRWQPETGSILKHIRAQRPHEAVVAALLGLHSLGSHGSWETRLVDPIWVSFGGHILRLDGDIGVTGTDTSLEIYGENDSSPTVSFSSSGAGWRISEEITDSELQYGAPSFVNVRGFEDVYVHPWLEPELPNPVIEWPIATEKDRDNSLASVASSHVADALNVIEAAGDQYLRWIRPLFRGIAATRLSFDDMRQSGSADEYPGVFSCGFPGYGPESTAEVIIHEISHQHYILMNNVSPLAIDNPSEQYYSSFKGATRPLSRVFLSYHAAANMALFWHDLSKNVALSAYYVAEQLKIDEHVQNLGKVLKDARGMTDAGKDLFVAQNQLLVPLGLAAC